MSRWRSALAIVALLGAAMVPLALAATVAPASAATFNVQPVPGTRFLFDVACPTANNCVAAGQFDDPNTGGSTGALVPITNGVAGTPQLVAGTSSLRGVACSDATTCVAVGLVVDFSNVSHAVVVPFTLMNGTIVTGAVQTLSDANNLVDVACYSATSCVAVGGPLSLQGVVVPITNGVAGPAQLVPNVRRGLTGVACYSATSCTAVGLQVVGLANDGVVVQITSGVAGPAQLVTPSRSLSRVGCGPSICEATGIIETPRNPGILPIVGGVPGTLQPVPSDLIFVDPLIGISCASDTFCAAVGNASAGGVFVPVYSGVPAQPQVAVPGGQLYGIACTATDTATTATACVAVGNNATGTEGVVVNITINPICNNKEATIVGTNGNDRLFGTSGDDVIVGLGGNDSIYGYGGNDTICAGDGNDVVYGGDGNDYIDGGAGDDIGVGDAGNDLVLGGDGSDRIFASAGTDTLDGGPGFDYCYRGTVPGTTTFQNCDVFPAGM